MTTQSKILRAIQQNVIRRIGGKETIETNVRFIAATNKIIDSLVEEKLFREDLYYRLSTGIFHLPPLRERKNDIPHLVDFFLNDFCQCTKKELVLGDHLLDIFRDYDWPGNIRELKNLLNYMCAVSTEQILTQDDLPPSFQAKHNKKVSNTLINNTEKNLIISVLKKVNFNKKCAAEILGISRTTLYAKMKKYNLILKTEL